MTKSLLPRSLSQKNELGTSRGACTLGETPTGEGDPSRDTTSECPRLAQWGGSESAKDSRVYSGQGGHRSRVQESCCDGGTGHHRGRRESFSSRTLCPHSQIYLTLCLDVILTPGSHAFWFSLLTYNSLFRASPSLPLSPPISLRRRLPLSCCSSRLPEVGDRHGSELAPHPRPSRVRSLLRGSPRDGPPYRPVSGGRTSGRRRVPDRSWTLRTVELV